MEEVTEYITMHENNTLPLIQHMVFMKDELKLQSNHEKKLKSQASEHRDRQFTALISMQKEKYLPGKANSHKDEKSNFREIPFIKQSSWKECKCSPLLSCLEIERNCTNTFRYI